ncbi:hypothetical protein OSB04_000108 [Centaurea solstitialis]|uniref:ATPase F1/V1/A1 complex alpha/beta subunit N-terminal domain-containing protein n=1 Tax=Centaurea solstitialis TaxID=347529 RepID=A0AA38WKC9_9ASTR|nr:hypothetical protein OSB04_000108 [Centaurea solstitialis]
MVTIQADEISNIIRDCIDQYNREVKIINTGTVLQVGDDIARIHGLDEVMAGELVEFEEGTRGIALNLESTNVGVVLMGDEETHFNHILILISNEGRIEYDPANPNTRYRHRSQPFSGSRPPESQPDAAAPRCRHASRRSDGVPPAKPASTPTLKCRALQRRALSLRYLPASTPSSLGFRRRHLHLRRRHLHLPFPSQKI